MFRSSVDRQDTGGELRRPRMTGWADGLEDLRTRARTPRAYALVLLLASFSLSVALSTGPFWQAVLAGTAAILLVVALTRFVRFAFHLSHVRIAARMSAAFLEDGDAIFITDQKGRIHSVNQSAAQFAAATDMDEVLGCIGPVAAGPHGRKLEGPLAEVVAAEQDVRAGLWNGPLGFGLRFWRIRTAPDRTVCPPIPIFRLSPAGTVIGRNAPAARLPLGQPTTIEEILERSGRLRTTGGGRTSAAGTVVHDMTSDDGDRFALVLPGEPGNPTQPEQASIEHLPIPLLRLREGGAIEAGNRRASEFLNHDLTGEVRFGDLVDGLGRGTAEWVNAVLNGGCASRAETVHVTHASKETHARVTLARVLTPDGPRVLAVLSDATELKTLEAQFVQSQKMHAIGQLAGGIAHDFNNVLAAISGHCDLLRLRDDLRPEARADLDQISRNADRAAGLVGQLLAFSRKQELGSEPLDLTTTLSDLTHLLDQLVGPRVRMEYSHDPDLAAVLGDHRQLEQVLMNLVLNARDAMGEGGGTIRITTRNRTLADPLDMEVVELPAGRYVTVQVEDEGAGIPPDVLPRIFEPFFTTKPQGQGTGLGLSTVYGIVKQSGGYIFAGPRDGGGTTFTLWFPSIDASSSASEERPDERTDDPGSREGGSERGTVLLCDDEPSMRRFAAQALRLRGFEVIEAESGEQALDCLGEMKVPPDVLVSDVIMGGLDGPAWTRHALESHRGLPVVFMSGYTEGALDRVGDSIPQAEFLAKPFPLDVLISTVERALHSRIDG